MWCKPNFEIFELCPIAIQLGLALLPCTSKSHAHFNKFCESQKSYPSSERCLSRIFLQTTKVIGSETELLLKTTIKSRTIDHLSENEKNNLNDLKSDSVRVKNKFSFRKRLIFYKTYMSIKHRISPRMRYSGGTIMSFSFTIDRLAIFEALGAYPFAQSLILG